MIPPHPADCIDLEALVEVIGSFCVGLLDRPLLGDSAHGRLDIHETVLKPILSRSVLCRLYLPKGAAEISAELVLNRGRNFLDLDLNQDLITGREFLWNIAGRQRGSIVIGLPSKSLEDHLFDVFKKTTAPVGWSSKSQLRKCHTPSAIDFADKLVAEDHIVFCLPASNGIEWMDIFAPKQELLRLFQSAQEQGRTALSI